MSRGIKDKTGIVKFNSYRVLYKPKKLPKEHPANQKYYDAVGKEFTALAVFKDDDIWQFFTSNYDGSSAKLGAIHYDDLEFLDKK